MFVTTINRTPQSYALAIIAAEYILNLVPRGTHEWNKFVKPEDLANILVKSNKNLRTYERDWENLFIGKIYFIHFVEKTRLRWSSKWECFTIRWLKIGPGPKTKVSIMPWRLKNFKQQSATTAIRWTRRLRTPRRREPKLIQKYYLFILFYLIN